ncbi:MAG: hypothetical protein KDC87_00635, partial [Planctomycetes bacterium]|nr:hypothetical protein [Planctomycetota bacterium]
RVANLGIKLPYYRHAGGLYIKQIDGPAVARMFEELADAASRSNSWFDPSDAGRFHAFHDALSGWLETARNRAAELMRRAEARRSTTPPPPVRRPANPQARSTPTPSARQPAEQAPCPAAAEPRRPTPLPSPVIEPVRMDWIRNTYGAGTLQALSAAFLTKPLVILRGDPGVGKSHLAVRLLDDEPRHRTCVVAVGATWRGREDLLGYVNPVSNAFSATPFTRFLVAAERAWAQGDRRPRLVVFEEFNISQPEHWLADLLVVTQFDAEVDRRIELGGTGNAELGGVTSVCLTPAVHFLATINTDHTTRPLSPRVLDRSAIVSLTLDPREALAAAEVELSEDLLGAISRLHSHLQRKGASFSVRAALSLRACLAARESLGLDAWGALDLVLEQEVLSKVRLLARDPIDEELLEQLDDWSQDEGSSLTRCSVLIEGWKERLATGQDVIQA